MEMTPAAVVLGLSCICFAAFAWAINGHFRNRDQVPTGMKLVSALSIAAFAWFVWRLLVHGPAAAWLFAAALFVTAFMLFTWTVRATRRTPPTLAFSDDRPAFLLSDGPYHYVRHPFYLAYIIFWLATAVATPGVIGWVAPVIMLSIYRIAAGLEERKFADSAFAGAYAAYRAKAGMFLPRLSILLRH